MKKVSNLKQLLQALEQQVLEIVITRSILATTPIFLPSNVKVRGQQQENGEYPSLSFEGSDGIGVSENNTISHLTIQAPPTNRAIFLASTKTNVGKFTFLNLKLTGQFSFITSMQTKTAALHLDEIDILYADARTHIEQQLNYGVVVKQGALTIFNFNSDEDSTIDVQATNISIGRKDAPVIGSGIFIAGFGEKGGTTNIRLLQTKNVYSNGKIPFGVANVITGAIIILNGAHANEIVHDGETVTYGVNDMVLDAWGTVDQWLINGDVISYGASGVGFVNFGTVKHFIAKAPITTYGEGARGYNQYDGTLEHGEFASIQTYGNGSVGIQVSKKVGDITVHGNIETHGDVGNSLVKGVNIDLPAYAFSLKDGGEINSLTVKGNIQTFGNDVTTFTVESGGIIHHLQIDGDVKANGNNANVKDIAQGSQLPNIDF